MHTQSNYFFNACGVQARHFLLIFLLQVLYFYLLFKYSLNVTFGPLVIEKSIPQVMGGRQNCVSSLAKLTVMINVPLLHSSSRAPVLFFLKVPLYLLKSARLLISLFYLSLTALEHLSTLKSIVED